MDAIIKQMIAVDNQAAQLVKDAESKAAGILETARREATALDKKLEAECQAEVDGLIRARIEAAEKTCAQDLETEEGRLVEENRRVQARVPDIARAIAAVLAYPSSTVR